mgnify:CR=1 FL=1
MRFWNFYIKTRSTPVKLWKRSQCQMYFFVEIYEIQLSEILNKERQEMNRDMKLKKFVD